MCQPSPTNSPGAEFQHSTSALPSDQADTDKKGGETGNSFDHRLHHDHTHKFDDDRSPNRHEQQRVSTNGKKNENFVFQHKNDACFHVFQKQVTRF